MKFGSSFPFNPLLLFVFTMLQVLLGQAAFSQTPPIKIGVSLPLTGEAAVYGQDIKNAIEFANARLTGNHYQLLFEDDKCAGKDAVSIAVKFSEIEHLKYVLGPGCSGTLLSAAPVYEKAGVVVMGIGTSSPAVSQAGDYIFRYSISDSGSARALYAYMVKRNYKRMAVLSEETDYCQGFKLAFQAAGQGSSVAQIHESYLPGTNDFRAILLKLKNSGAEALFINPQAEGTLIDIVKQIRDLKWEVPLYGAYYESSPTFLKALGAKANGITFIDVPSPDSLLSQDGAVLYSEFNAKYGGIKSNPCFFVYGFEAFRAMSEAIGSGRDVKSYLEQTEFHGVTGNYHFDKNGDLVESRLVIKRIKDGKPEAVQELTTQ